ncbi:MAG: 5-(carboxyamino)imidazole ribonucleotide mutase [Bdellovibrionales bacterium CG10_big_fil_rev_8_21_14_0_10_45_34]|nr:MAG: 5-(carboxyamino)imidazole ribonucleotide mutase [Bdellovibrionales bacterium CG10_big_fil_rev_8_21_14_0_10_45_34]
MKGKKSPKVLVIMGSQSDWPVMKEACRVLKQFKVPYLKDVVSAHRTPKKMYDVATNAEKSGFAVIVAGAGGSAHLPGMVASLTNLPVIGVPVETKSLKGIDSLLSIVQMPPGVPVATVSINGARNAGLLAVKIICLCAATGITKGLLKKFVASQAESVSKMSKKVRQTKV